MPTKLSEKIAGLPESPGIYQFFSSSGQLLYVGKSISIKKRVSSYFSAKDLGSKTDQLVKKIRNIKFIKVFSEFEALLLESELIRKNQPFYNIIAKDDKSPIYIKITGVEVPLISTTRRRVPQEGIFLKGPFPSAKTTREILRIIRRIFPYCHHQNPRRPCLYVHLGLCPYPWAGSDIKQDYQKTVAKIKKLLSGKISFLIKSLTREMTANAKSENFEKAQEIKKQIEKLQFLTAAYHSPQEFLETPTLVDDQIAKRLSDLQSVLALTKPPKRIECYDISNIGGKLATGSMVVFTNGHPDRGEYRRFKIKFVDHADDYQMLKEVLTRRFKNKWPLPDLVIIDGGRGQLNAALSTAKNLPKPPFIVSLAKRFEEIFTPDKILPISLSKESPARQLAEHVRNEAHRFAVSYHRLLRSKRMLEIKS